MLPVGTLLYSFAATAQNTASTQNPHALLKHGVEQYKEGHYNLATHTLATFLKYNKNTSELNKESNVAPKDREEALFYKTLAGVKLRDQILIAEAVEYVVRQNNAHYQQRVAYELAKYYLEDNRDLYAAIRYYEIAGVGNLSNEEIADAKFELGYAYFITQDFTKARNLFVGIKDIESNKYYIPANYYYGLLSYREGRLDDALRSFKKVRNEEEYKDIIPYYEAEIYYFKGEYDKVLEHSRKYLAKKGEMYYDKEMRLLTGQTLFELKRYQEALPYLEDYYENTERIRKEELYELAYTYYQLKQYDDAIDKFQPLSNAQDTLAQTAMYLLGDCYLKVGDKKGARNAFGLCAEMDFVPAQKEAATFLYNKLSYDQGFDPIAARGFRQFLKDYPKSVHAAEAKSLLSALLLKSNNYAEAFELLSEEANKDAAAWATFQKAAVGRGLQLMQDKNYSDADSVLTASLYNPVNPSLEAVAYFWKGEIAYQQGRYTDAISYSNTFLKKASGYEEAIKKVSPKATVQNANMNLGYASLKVNDYKLAETAFAGAQQGGDKSNLNAEAVLRQADAAFMQKDFDAAARLYDRAIAQNVTDADYARYQKALILGLQNKSESKIELLNYIVAKGDKKMVGEASLELAAEYINTENASAAIPLLKKVRNNEANSIQLKTRATYLLAYAYQETGQNKDAIVTYKEYITKYPTGTERKSALIALSNLYSQEPEQYERFLREQKITDVSEQEVELVFYDAGDNEFNAGNYTKAIEHFKKYLERYPNGSYTIQSHYYLGESYYQLGEKTKALASFEQVLTYKWNNFSEDAAMRRASIFLADKDFAAAKASYNLLLENNAGSDVAAIYEGMMKVSFEEQDYDGAQTWADMLLAVGAAGEDMRRNAKLYKARALQEEGKYEDAKALYQQLDKENVGNVSAEARYRLAHVLFLQKRNDAAEQAASYAAQASNNNTYWTIKNYLLLADILADNKDYFNAKATLQSIIKNAKEPELVAEAKTKLDAVKAQEAAGNKLK